MYNSRLYKANLQSVRTFVVSLSLENLSLWGKGTDRL